MAVAMGVAVNPSTCIVFSRIPYKTHSNGIASRKKLRVMSSSDVATPSNKEAISARDNLLNLISGEERGLKTQKNPSKRSQIINAIDALAAFGTDTVTTDSRLSGTWRMMWTTEKEQLFIIERAHLFGTQVGDVLQVIDVNRSTLNNVITFPPSGAFVVASTIQIVSSQRVNFRQVLDPEHISVPLSTGKLKSYGLLFKQLVMFTKSYMDKLRG